MNKSCRDCKTIWSDSIRRCSCGGKVFFATQKRHTKTADPRTKCRFCASHFANDVTLTAHENRMHRYQVLKI